ncbi:uncharacterized protein tmem79a [Trichomycterus rosablanca]|uniref:uncharacterized protein tmem79a n=1 Tax=Trichomycterus rosablanca TaxID=2290929 RepID=UPI002F360CAC
MFEGDQETETHVGMDDDGHSLNGLNGEDQLHDVHGWMDVMQDVADEGRLENRVMGWESRTESERHLDDDEDNRDYGDDGSLADDEEEEDGDDDDDDHQGHDGGDEDARMLGKSFSFTPQVTIVRTTAEKQNPHDDVRTNDANICLEETKKNKTDFSKERCGGGCGGELLMSGVALVAGALLFPLLVWGGYELLPFDSPAVGDAPYRLVYTLRCSLFASLPIVLGVLVYGVSRLRFISMTPMFEGKREDGDALLHMSFVRDSIHLLLIFFIQLSVTSTYVQQGALRVVPLLTVVFCFGRLIYWVALYFRSSIRALGFSLSFLPVLVLLGFNLFYICSSTDEGAVFHVATPTTAPPPRARWWG